LPRSVLCPARTAAISSATSSTPHPASELVGQRARDPLQPPARSLAAAVVGSAKSRGLGRLSVSTGRSRRAVGGSRPGTPG
jgi:hypothetical protein